jgi:hypothetical protein
MGENWRSEWKHLGVKCQSATYGTGYKPAYVCVMFFTNLLIEIYVVYHTYVLKMHWHFVYIFEYINKKNDKKKKSRQILVFIFVIFFNHPNKADNCDHNIDP